MMAMLVGGCAAAHGQIVNGSFEDPDIANGSYLTVYAGENTIPGWTVTSGSMDIVDGIPSNGEQSLDLQGDGAGEIQQTLGTTAGMRYRVEFDYYSGAQVEEFRAYLLWNGVVQQRLEGGAFHQEVNRVIQAEGGDVLGLRSVFQHTRGIIVDNITVTQVPIDTPLTPIPEPGTYALISGAMLGVWALWRRVATRK